MGDVVPIREPNQGNGAKKALDRYFSANVYGAYIAGSSDGPASAASSGGWIGLSMTDHLLAWLWVEGFIVKPLEDK